MTLSIEENGVNAGAQSDAPKCPVHRFLPQRKTQPAGETSSYAVEISADNVYHISDYESAKKVLRANTSQAGFQAELVGEMPNSMNPPILFLEGKPHLQQRKQTARFFTPATTRKNYRQMMIAFADDVIDEIKREKRVDLSDLSMKLAVNVAAQVVGLTDSRIPGMPKRIGSFITGEETMEFGWRPRQILSFLTNQFKVGRFYYLDVAPAIKKRRKNRQEDVISHLLDNEYGNVEIMTECITYGAAGMVTTREFISVVAWHMLENAEMRERYLAAEEAERHQILHELLRLEPVIARLMRRAQEDIEVEANGEKTIIPKGALIDMHIYPANADADAVGEDGLSFCPERELAHKVQPYAMSFGDGNHRCPGAFIAIQESDIFLQKLLAIPGVRLESAPSVSWNEVVKGYELRNFIIAVD